MRDVLKNILSNASVVNKINNHFIKVAKRKASRLGATSSEVLWEDIAQSGWEGFISSGGSLKTAYNHMNQEWCKWLFGRSYKGNKTNWEKGMVGMGDLELTDIQAVSVEAQVIGRDLYSKIKFHLGDIANTGNLKADNEQIKKIHELHDNGMSQRDISGILGIGRTTVRTVLSGRLVKNTKQIQADQASKLLDMMLEEGSPTVEGLYRDNVFGRGGISGKRLLIKKVCKKLGVESIG